LLIVELSFIDDSELHSAKLALTESAGHELLSNYVDILVLLHEHEVGMVVGEAEVIERTEGCLHAFVLKLLNLLAVELLRGLGIDAECALHQGAGLLERIDGLLEENISAFHLLVVGISALIGSSCLLRDHLNCLGDRLDQIRLDFLVEDWLGGFDTEDVAADLVAKLDPTSL